MTIEEYAKALPELEKFEAYCHFLVAHEIAKRMLAAREFYRDVPVDWNRIDEAIRAMDTLREEYARHTDPQKIRTVAEVGHAIDQTVKTASRLLEACASEDRLQAADETESFVHQNMVVSHHIIRSYDKGLAWRTNETIDLFYGSVQPHRIPGWSGYRHMFGKTAFHDLRTAIGPMIDWFGQKHKELAR